MPFSQKTIDFIRKASRQRSASWLDKNREPYEQLVQEPFKELASYMKQKLSVVAPDYHFPQKGIARLRAQRPQDSGGLYKNWLSYSASRPKSSRFEGNPNLYFVINTPDRQDTVVVAGGLYLPSSKQVRAIRESLANDESLVQAFEKLFSTKTFSKRFKGGFAQEKKSSRMPRGFDPLHPKAEWLRLQAFFVWRSYRIKDFASPGFLDLLASDWRLILQFNELLDRALRHVKSAPSQHSPELGGPRYEMDF